jgi:two-component system phosphate regulon sensor histidine kinase PhoR
MSRKKRTSFFVKIFGGYLLVTLILIIAFFTLTYRIVRHHYIATLTDNLVTIGQSITAEIATQLADQNLQQIDPSIKNLGQRLNIRLTVIAPDGTVLADSDENPLQMENHGKRREVMQALEGKTGSATRFSKTLQDEMLYVALPIYRQDRIIGVIRTSLWMKDINTLLRSLWMKLFQISLLVLFLAMLAAALLAKRFADPIQKLIAASRKVAKGEFDTKVGLDTRDETGELGESFNEMTGKIQELFEQISLEKDELNCIISSIDDGLAVINQENKIVLSNQSFRKLIGPTKIESADYREVFQDPKLIALIDRIAREKQNFVEEISRDRRELLCSFSYAESKADIVLVFHDISNIKKLENVKRDFVSNVSHELRTPMTAIKGFVETLLDEEQDPDKQRYLSIIQRHTDRLIHIVQDLLMLSKLEDRDKVLQFEELDLTHLLTGVLKMFESRLREKRLQLELDIDPELPRLQVDSFKIEQMFINLIDNAIKYTDKGKIIISFQPAEKGIEIRVSDTGIGIPEKHFPRIFERFYVVDKSRSRSSGGTGLGLSIVKHIVLLHQGDIKVTSTSKQGSSFIITLPFSQS